MYKRQDVGEASFDLKTYHQWLRGNRLWLRESQGARVLVFRTAQESKIVVPKVLRDTVLRLNHQGHPGIVATMKRVRKRFIWPGMTEDVATYVKGCTLCLEKHGSDHHVGDPGERNPSRAWEVVYVDLMGPFSPATKPAGYQYILSVLDGWSKYLTLIPITDKKAETVASRISRLFLRYGVPDVLYSDPGTEFANHLQAQMARDGGYRQKFTLPAAPWSNQVERIHRTVGCLLYTSPSPRD